jgi:hypothetical protein
MSCNGGKSTKKGKYNKKQNLMNPVSYTIDKNGNVKPIYKTK